MNKKEEIDFVLRWTKARVNSGLIFEHTDFDYRPFSDSEITRLKETFKISSNKKKLREMFKSDLSNHPYKVVIFNKFLDDIGFKHFL